MREHRGKGQLEIPCLGRSLALDEMYRGVL